MSDVPSRRGIPFVVAAPSGTGKTTVCRSVIERDPEVEFSISYTTRPRRANEVDGVSYHFVTSERFRRLIEEGAFLEWAVYDDNHYGTSREATDEQLAAGRDLLLEIEVQGARQVREKRADARFIFLLPPSMQVLERRLRLRGTNSPEQIERRRRAALAELDAVRGFDYAVINDDLERCVEDVLEVLRAERAGATGEVRRRFEPRAGLERFGGGEGGGGSR